MPKKIRELKAMLQVAGFTGRSGKGSHTVWTHPAIPGVKVVIAGNDGQDSPPYLEKQVQRALKQVGTK